MTRDWTRLAAAVRAQRLALDMTQVDLATQADVSVSTIQLLESGEKRSRPPRSLGAVERALRWAPGSGEGVLAGGDPAPIAEETKQPPSTSAPPALADGMPSRVRHELSHGRVVDTAVVDSARPGGGRFVLVWKSDDPGSEIDPDDLAEWTRLQRELHDIPRRSDPGT